MKLQPPKETRDRFSSRGRRTETAEPRTEFCGFSREGTSAASPHYPLAETSHVVLPNCKGRWEVQRSSGRRREPEVDFRRRTLTIAQLIICLIRAAEERFEMSGSG